MVVLLLHEVGYPRRIRCIFSYQIKILAPKVLVWSRTPTNSMSSWARTWLTASLYTVMILKYSSSKASSEILPDIIVVSGVNHATSYLFYIWWSSQSRWFKVCRLGKASVEPTAYCLLPQSLTYYGLKCRTYRMSTTRCFFTQSRLRIHH